VAVETSGACGPKALTFLRELGQKITVYSENQHSFSYLMLRLSVAVQQGIAASVLGTREMPDWDYE
jgi:hypothetical protein